MAEQEKDPLFPVLPEDLKSLSDDEVQKLLDDSVAAAALIDADDEEFLAGLTADEIIEQYAAGVESIKLIQAENKERLEAFEQYKAEKERLKAELQADDESEGEGDDEGGDTEDGAEATEVEVVAEADSEADADESVEEPAVAEPVAVTASTTASNAAPPRFSRTPPAPAKERIVVNEPVGTALVAAGEMSLQFKDTLDAGSLAEVVKAAAIHHGPHPKVDAPGKYRFGGPEHKIARADFGFPEERTLDGDVDGDIEKIRQVMPSYVNLLGRPGGVQGEALVASGGLCAPLTPIYTMPNFATEAEPVWDSLPVFRAQRGGVNVPTPTSIGDITTAISSISEAEDAQGGTFATKSCQALDCPDYTETAVQILAHCREYGNLNARAWPEKIAHENALTMAALARTSELFMVDRIKTLSINLTQAEVLGAYGDFVQAALRARSGIIDRLRMSLQSRFNLLVPGWLPSMFAADTAYTQFDRYQNQTQMAAHLESLGFRTVYYMDGVTGGTSQSFADEVAATALDDFPDDVQWGIYPEGQFLGIDSGTLELGIVRDSELNRTNDFQVFGERFRNLAMLGPAQGALWIVQGVCPSGEFPALGTALAC